MQFTLNPSSSMRGALIDAPFASLALSSPPARDPDLTTRATCITAIAALLSPTWP